MRPSDSPEALIMAYHQQDPLRAPADRRSHAALRGYHQAKTLLGWEPRIGLRQGLELSLDYFRAALPRRIRPSYRSRLRESVAVLFLVAVNRRLIVELVPQRLEIFLRVGDVVPVREVIQDEHALTAAKQRTADTIFKLMRRL
jgi:hypothetical protein